MRQLLILSLLWSIAAGSCSKTNSVPVVLDGTYTGTFQRQTATGGLISNVTITFSDSTWMGQSQFVKYPALCHGTYKLIGADSITMNNDCVWTAEFDWTLILGQNYRIKMVDKTIELTRDYNGVVKDVYKLTKQ